ncbi:hypothetical protein DIPPA_53544 [Diplonema papillatum]|nr:hypothetical protein DIPPA_53544 [Diplonema papillatum]
MKSHTQKMADTTNRKHSVDRSEPPPAGPSGSITDEDSTLQADLQERVQDQVTLPAAVPSPTEEPEPEPKESAVSNSEVNATSVDENQTDADKFRAFWERKRKHIFIFSNASRPIFTRYGDETEFLDFFGMMGLMVSATENIFKAASVLDVKKGGPSSETEEVRYMKAGDRTYVFVRHSAIHYLAVSNTGESVRTLASQLNFVNAVLLSILTENMYKIFDRRTNYDLRGLMGSSADSMLKGAVRIANNNPSFGLSAVPVLRLRKATRDKVTRQLKQRMKDCGVDLSSTAYAFMFYNIPGGRTPYGGAGESNNTLLITYLSPERASIDAVDYNVLTNFVHSSLPAASKYQEMWAPCCLPGYSTEGFLYMYMTFMTPTVALVIVSCATEAFPACSAVKDALVNDFNCTGRERIDKGIPPGEPTTGCLHDVVSPRQYTIYNVRDVDLLERPGEVLHFMYSDLELGQMTAARYNPPFVGKKQQKGLLRMYYKGREAAQQCTGSKKTMIFSTEHYTVFVRLGKSYELYVTYRPLVTKAQVAGTASLLKKWIRMQHDTLFAPPTAFVT